MKYDVHVYICIIFLKSLSLSLYSKQSLTRNVPYTYITFPSPLIGLTHNSAIHRFLHTSPHLHTSTHLSSTQIQDGERTQEFHSSMRILYITHPQFVFLLVLLLLTTHYASSSSSSSSLSADNTTTTSSTSTNSSNDSISDVTEATTNETVGNSSENSLADALKEADERMSKIQEKLKEESNNLRSEAEEARRREMEREKLAEMRRKRKEKMDEEVNRKIREKQILVGLTQFREHVLQCLRVLKGGANDLYYTILRTLSNIPASKICMMFKEMSFPRLPIHGFTQQMEHYSIEADDSGAVDMFLDSTKHGIFRCMCERNPLLGTHALGAPVIVNQTLAILNRRGAPDMDAIVSQFQAAVKKDIEHFDPSEGTIGPALVEGPGGA